MQNQQHPNILNQQNSFTSQLPTFNQQPQTSQIQQTQQQPSIVQQQIPNQFQQRQQQTIQQPIVQQHPSVLNQTIPQQIITQSLEKKNIIFLTFFFKMENHNNNSNQI